MPRPRSPHILALAAFCLLTTPLLAAAADPAPDWIVVLDLAEEAPPNRVHSFPYDPNALVCGDTTREALKLDLTQRKTSGNRWVSMKGSTVSVRVFYDPKTPEPKIAFNEEERQSRFNQDLSTLFDIIKEVKGAIAQPISCLETTYSLTKVRANLKIKASQQVKGDAEKGAAVKADAENKERSAEVTLVTGPREHWFLSTDVAVNRVSELEYDPNSASLEPKEQPTSFLIGFDFLLGDLANEDRKWWEGFVIKGFVEASKQPRNGLGAGIGYRLKPIKKYGFELDTFSPFVGWVRTRDDVVTRGGSVRQDADTSFDFIYGISLNLDRALGWLKKTK